MCSRLVLFFLIVLISNYPAVAQPDNQITIRTLSEQDGLSEKNISSIVQDKNGLLWFATENGLSRYDGSKVKTYYTPDSNATAFGQVKYLYALSKSGIWVCTASDLYYFHTDGERFYHMLKSQNPRIVTNGKKTFLADYNHFYSLPAEKDIITKNAKPIAFLNLENNSALYNILYDKTGSLWSFTPNKIIRVSDNNYQTFAEYPFSNMRIQTLYFDNKNRCWVGTWGNGIFLFDSIKGKLERIPANENDFVTFSFTSYLLNKQQYILACTDNAMVLINEATLQTLPLSGPKYTLNASFSDNQNNIWLASNEGVKVISNNQLFFSITGLPGFTKGGVYSIKETDGGIWASKRYYGGIYLFNKNLELKKSIPFLSKNKTGNNAINTSEGFDFFEKKGKTYITTDLGIFILDSANNKQLIVPDGLPAYLPQLRNMGPENDSLLWVRSYQQGVFLFNTSKNKFIAHYPIYYNASLQPVHYLLRTKKGKLYASTYNGLFAFNKQKESFEKISLQNAPSEYMLAMAEDKNGIVWICSSNGLFSFNPQTSTIAKRFSQFPEMGLCYRLCVDDYNNIWFNCQKGYWCWVQSRQQMIQFGYNLNLPNNKTEAGFSAGANGKIYAGATDAIVTFFSKNIMNYDNTFKSIITDIEVDNKNIIPQVLNDSTKSLQLKAGNHNVSIDFSVLDFNFSNSHEMLYSMQPGDSNWIAAKNSSINISNLSKGKHIITVTGRNNINGKLAKPYFLHIAIPALWYQTNIFKFGLIALVAFLLYYFIKLRIKSIRKQAALNQKIAESEIQLLRVQMNPHFIFNSLNSIENFILKNEKRLASDYLNKFARLIRMILDSSRNEWVPFEKDMETLQLYIDLEAIRFNNKFSYKTIIDKNIVDEDIKVPSLLIQPYVENAIIHGLAHSDANNLQLTIKAVLLNDYIQYCIIDNGIGRAASARYNKHNKPYHKSVGMEISKERIIRFNEKAVADEAIKITDLYDVDNNPSGTMVEINIKVK